MTQRPFDIVCMGNALVDILAFVEYDFLEKHQIEKGTWSMVSEQESAALYDLMPPARELSGGAGANTVAGLASLGGKCRYLGVVNDDAFGKIFQHDIKAYGVDFPLNPSIDGDGTGRCISLITPDGDRTMITYLGASINFTPDMITPDTIGQGQIFLTEAYLWNPLPLRKVMMQAVNVAKEAGMKTAFTLSDIGCIQNCRAELLPFLIDHIDIIVGNEAEITCLYNTNFDQAVLLAQEHFSVTALTKGNRGSILTTKGETFEIETTSVTKVVDTTGAGDIYASGFFYGLIQKYDFPTIGKIASTTASEIITHIGSRPEKSLSQLIEKKVKNNV